MKSFLFKQEILEAKIKGLEKYDEGITRRLLPDKINQKPEKWEVMPVFTSSWQPELWNFYSPDSFDDCIDIKPRYQVGDVCYFREPFRYIDLTPRPRVERVENPLIQYRIDMKYNQEWGGAALVTDEFRSPYSMTEKLARHFVTVTEVRPERLDISKLSLHEIELEGGEVAIKPYAGYDGKWVFRYHYKRVERP